jgi:hypothetical protein
MLRSLITVAALLSLTGCGAFMATSEDLYYHEEVFAPRRTSDTIEIFEQGLPRTPYIVLGRIVATQGMFGSRESVLAEMRAKAARMGADALVEISTGKAPDSDAGTARQESDTTRFNQEGNVSTSEHWVPDPKASLRLTLSGLAIRYRSPD